MGGVVHTHSPYATSWAQAGRSIPCYGTTHADYFYGPVPCLRVLTGEEIDEGYEMNTGKLIVNEFASMGKDYEAVSAVLCKNHGPFCWGKDGVDAVHCAVVLEEVSIPGWSPLPRSCRTSIITESTAPTPITARTDPADCTEHARAPRPQSNLRRGAFFCEKSPVFMLQ